MGNDGVCLTIDYERDWGGRVQGTYAIEKMTDKVLEIFDEYGTRGTFFISTETVGATKSQILAIAKAGHEIASHGHDHNVKYDLLTREELAYQAKTSKNILEDLTGKSVLGFRTPQFRKNEYTEEVLSECGYVYDSSSVSISFRGRYAANQHSKGIMKSFPVSSIYNKFPAGIKWINMLGKGKLSGNPPIVYLHLFDLLDLSDTIGARHRNISYLTQAFYFARIGSNIKSMKYFIANSHSIIKLLDR